MAKPLLAPFAWLYGVILAVRHKMFDWGWLRSRRYDIPIVCVGNLTVGGTGKTPFTEFLADHLTHRFNVAILSRGYGRRTKGYLEVQVNTPYLDSGDEPKQMKLRFPQLVVAVCEDRQQGIERIRATHPEVNLIIMDDGFQHRYVEPWINIVLMDMTRPIYKDHLLPWGSLRDLKKQIRRADYVVATKCPPGMSPIDRRIVYKSLSLYPYQSLYFTTMEESQPLPVFPGAATEPIGRANPVVAMSGIGNPDAFRQTLCKRFDVAGELIFPDHHIYRTRDISKMERALAEQPASAVIVTTEKDRVKFCRSSKFPDKLKGRIYYLPIRIKFNGESEKGFLKKLDEDVRTNPQDRLIH